MDEYDFIQINDSKDILPDESDNINDDCLDYMKSKISCNITDDNFDEICDDSAFIQQYSTLNK